jgi:hypothetical protein
MSNQSIRRRFMQIHFVQSGNILLKGWRNNLISVLFNCIQPVYRKICKSDVAYIYCKHPVLSPFLIRLKTKLGINIHFRHPDADFSGYRKVIVPNGKWPNIRAACERIPEDKKVYCEVGFFPQNHNVYFDDEGVHGHSSIRNIDLPKLDTSQKERLEAFKSDYTSRNYIRLRWDTVNNEERGSEETFPAYEQPFVFVPLQLESDTAFDLCPFDTNQELIDAIEHMLPAKRIIFKVHPRDRQSRYKVSDNNVLLPRENKDLQKLLKLSDIVVNCNSTVMLEALLYDKKCASLGIGFATNHNVSLECHAELDNLKNIELWEPDEDKADSFLFHLLEKQISIEFWKSDDEQRKLLDWLKRYDVIEAC